MVLRMMLSRHTVMMQQGLPFHCCVSRPFLVYCSRTPASLGRYVTPASSASSSEAQLAPSGLNTLAMAITDKLCRIRALAGMQLNNPLRRQAVPATPGTAQTVH